MKTIIYTHKDFKLPPLKDTEPVVLVLGENKLKSTYGLSTIYEKSFNNRLIPQTAYSELSGLYSIAFNFDYEDDEIINLAHYRRYLSVNKNFICTDTFEIDLINYDFIVPKRIKLYFKNPKNFIEKIFNRTSVEDHYIYNHVKEDWSSLIDVLEDMHPECQVEINQFRKLKFLIPFNIFCCKYIQLKKYSIWLFKIFQKLELTTKPTSHTYQGRLYGFMGERLFTLYLIIHKMKFKEVEAIFIE